RLAPVLFQVPVHAVVGRVDLAAYEPFPERGVAAIEHRVVGLVPGQHVRIDLEAVGKPVEAEFFEDAGVPHVRLCLELLGGLKVFLLLPMHGDLRFADLGQLPRFRCSGHGYASWAAVLLGALRWLVERLRYAPRVDGGQGAPCKLRGGTRSAVAGRMNRLTPSLTSG